MTALFGKRVLSDPTASAVLEGSDPSGQRSIAGIAYSGGVPIVTIFLILLLSVIYAAEILFSAGRGASGPSVRDLVRIGAIYDQLVLAHHEYWRLFTAPLLHASAVHLIGNSIALLIAGLYLERLLGPWWFGAAFAFSGIGGCIGSLSWNKPGVVSVGASGAILGLFAMNLMLAYREDDDRRVMWMMRMSARILLPSLLAVGASGHTDYAGHLGGAAAGFILFLILTTWWDDQDDRPPYKQVGTGIVAIAACFAAYGLILGGL